MAKKIELLATILKELEIAQNITWEPLQTGADSGFSFPPQLWLGDGRSLAATDKLIAAISEYAHILLNNNQSLKSALNNQEFESLVQRAFAQSLGRVDKRDSQTACFMIQDCFLGSSYGSRGFVGRRMGICRPTFAV